MKLRFLFLFCGNLVFKVHNLLNLFNTNIMKSAILLFVLFVLGINLSAQNGISFQGIARDPQGNAIASQTISVKFTIGSFSETQNIDTDNFGVFSATIGSVNAVGFNNLDFASSVLNLKVEVDGTTIYDDKFNTVPYAKAAENGVPAGAIMPYAGTVTSGNSLQEPIPGWLVCNGATLTNDAKFTKLKTVLGTSWGTGLVPDLRGIFLRGVNNGRTDAFKDSEDRVVGNFQQDELESHNHTGTTTTNGAHTHNWTYPFSSSEGGDGSTSIMGDDQNAGTWNIGTDSQGAHSHTLNIANTGGSETRSKNAGIVYIIKY
ncbi:MAG: phage tail protein [Draconibacterium sp.]